MKTQPPTRAQVRASLAANNGIAQSDVPDKWIDEYLALPGQPPMNAQVEGPLSLSDERGGPYNALQLEDPEGLTCLVHGYPNEPRIQATAALLAAAYSAFDKAGRTLGVDATKLAQSLDLAALIRASVDAHESLTRLSDTDGAYRVTCAEQLRKALVDIPTDLPPSPL